MNPNTLITLFLFSCGILASCNTTTPQADNFESPKEHEHSSETESDYEKKMSNFMEEMDQLMAESDSLLEANKKELQVSENVNRKENVEPLNFNDYNWDGSFYYSYPQEAVFLETKKEDHTTFLAQSIVKGIVYGITIEDYSVLGEDKIDAGFTNYIHEKYILHFEGVIDDQYELKTENESFGFYSCYHYQLDNEEFYVDLVSFGFYDKMVRLSVTSKSKYENARRVQEFFDAFEIVP